MAKGLTKLNLPPTITNIAGWAFMDCEGLTGTLTFPPTITSIKFHAFAGCKGLTKVTIPEGCDMYSVFDDHVIIKRVP